MVRISWSVGPVRSEEYTHPPSGLRVCGATPRFTAAVKISSRIVEKRSLRNEKLKANRASSTEEQRKQRLRIRREKERKTKRISAWLFSKDCSGVMKMSWREN